MKGKWKRTLAVLLALAMSAPMAAAQEIEPLTEEEFSVDDIPADYLSPCEQSGRVEKLRYENVSGTVKSLMVYLPYGYDDSQDCYPVVYLLHGSGSSPKTYLNPESATAFQSLLDHMIQNGDLAPLIVVVPTYYDSSDDFTRYLPLADQVKTLSGFPDELVKIIIPAVESKYRTFLKGSDRDSIRASRMQRAVAGFSLGGTAAWYVFIQRMEAFGWFLPISEASWDDGTGGVTGIWDSDLSAQVLHDAVINQGFSKDDFYLYVATGTDDEAFTVATEQMISLLEYNDLFVPGENTSCSMMQGGTHTLEAVYTYLYHILPSLFK